MLDEKVSECAALRLDCALATYAELEAKHKSEKEREQQLSPHNANPTPQMSVYQVRSGRRFWIVIGACRGGRARIRKPSNLFPWTRLRSGVVQMQVYWPPRKLGAPGGWCSGHHEGGP
ncbi:hypothetical protein ONS96_007677 [Cadophora gregata f. sp. sojae]|nr:hypothetical protein ONS96_007677 [Cadophora gregata f. sp. sojae]